MIARLRGVALVCIYLFAACGTAVAAGEARTMLAHYADSVLTQTSLRGASWSVLFYSLTGDSVLFERDADRLLIPASLTKLVSSAAALNALGPDFRFTTACRYTGTFSADGTVSGNLLFAAGGDPTPELKLVDSLRKAALPAWAEQLYARGLRSVRGDLVVSTWPHKAEGAVPEWETGDIAGGFAPAVDGFGFNNNVCRLTVRPGSAAGSSASYTVDPAYAPVQVKLHVQTVQAGRGGWLELHVAQQDCAVVVTGEIPAGDDGEYLWLPVQNPALYFARALHSALRARGIEIGGVVRVDRSSGAAAGGVEFASFSSGPLAAMLQLVNKDSDNYTAEYVLRALGTAAGGADRRSGLQAVERFLKTCGIDQRNARFVDGSGLARQNLVSARALVSLLRVMDRHPAAASFKSSLAVAGVDGTLAYRLPNGKSSRRILAKTGTMTHVSGLAGYAETDGGERIVFAMLCNNFSTSLRHIRGVQDRLIERALLLAE